MKYLTVLLVLIPICVIHAQQKGDNAIYIKTQQQPEQALGSITQILYTQEFAIDTLHSVILSLETKPKKIVRWLKVFNLSVSVSIMYDDRIKLEGKWLEASVFGGEQGRNMRPLTYNQKGLEAKVWSEFEKIATTYVNQNSGKIIYNHD